MIFTEIKEKLEQLMKLKNINLIKLVDSKLIDDFTKIDKYHNDFVSIGYEGLMVRDKEGIYDQIKDLNIYKKFKKLYGR